MSEGLEPAELKDEPPRRKFKFPKLRIRRFLLTWMVRGLALLVLLALLLWGGIKLFVKPTDVARLIKDQVEEQTGGRMDIGRVSFNILTGIKLEDVAFYPPKAGDTRGSHYGGAVEQVVLANFDALDVRYSIRKALAGRVNIRALQLVKPQFHLHQIDGVFNFDSILAYRAVKFPPAPEEKKPEEAKKAETPAGEAAILPFDPDLVYVPIEIMGQSIGIKDLRLDLIKEEKGKVSQIIMTNGLSLDLGVHWLGNKSSIWVSLMSPFEHPLELDIQDNGTGELKSSLHLRTALSIRLELTDLRKVGFDLGLRMMELKTPAAGYTDLGAFAKIRLALEKDQKTIDLDTLALSVGDALDYDLGGKIVVNDAEFKSFAVKLKQKLAVDLKSAAALAKPFVPELKASGGLTLEDFKIDGTIEPDKMSAEGKDLPSASAVLWLEDVVVDYPGTGITMEPISGDLSVAAGPALNGSGSQVDAALNLNVPKIDLTQKMKAGEVKAGLENFTAKINARALWPDMVAPILKVNLEADHVKTSGKGVAAIDAPLYIDIDADGRKDLARMSLAANVELTDLAEVSAMADCQQRCEKFRSNAVIRLDSLANLHAIALPLGGALGAGDFMPSKLSGSLDFQFAARGRLPDPTTSAPDKLLREADVRFNTQLNLAKLDAVIPFMKINLKDFETRMLASGTTRQQKVEITHKFEALSLAVPRKDAPEHPMKVSAERFQFETSVQNDIDGAPELAGMQILKQLKTEVFNKLYFGRVDVEGILPRPINDFRISSLVKQSKLTDVVLDDLRIKLPDYGLSTTLFVDTKLDAGYFPTRLTTKLTADVQHNGDEKLPGGIKTVGKLGIAITAKTEDMKVALVDGGATFDNFNVNIPAKDGKGPATLTVDNISGELPFKQYVPIPEMRKRQPGAPGPAVAFVTPAPVGSDSSSGSGSAKDDGSGGVKIAEVHIKDGDGDGGNDGNGGNAGNAGNAGRIDDSKLNVAMDKYFEKNKNTMPADSNLVAMVDYGTVRPFYPERRPLSIKRVEVANLELSDMEFDLELRQQWFALNQFVINFLGGKIQGDLQLAFDYKGSNPFIPNPQNVHTSVHLTRLDTRKLLERFPNLKGKSSSSWNLFSNPYLDGNVHLKYDLKNNDIDGGLEITSIGKEQLKMILYYIDPFEQISAISDIRSKLDLAEVRQVSVPIKNGEIGLDIDLRLLGGVPFPTPKPSRLPLRQILQNLKDQKSEVTADADKKQ